MTKNKFDDKADEAAIHNKLTYIKDTSALLEEKLSTFSSIESRAELPTKTLSHFFHMRRFLGKKNIRKVRPVINILYEESIIIRKFLVKIKQKK